MEQVLVEAWFTFQLQSKYNLTRTLFLQKAVAGGLPAGI